MLRQWCNTLSQLVDANKKADVDVDFTMSRPAG